MKAPVEMPTMYVALQSFKLQRVDYLSPEASGRIGAVQAGAPLWAAVWTLGRMPEDNSDEWEAFLDSQRGATRRFIGRDLKRQYPKLYPDGFGAFGAFTGAASSWSQTINSDGDARLTLNLGAAAAGLVLSKRDGIDFRYSATEDRNLRASLARLRACCLWSDGQRLRKLDGHCRAACSLCRAGNSGCSYRSAGLHDGDHFGSDRR
jgi:hypothetical protein